MAGNTTRILVASQPELSIGCELGEGPLYDEETHTLYFLDIPKFQIHTYDVETKEHKMYQLEEPVGVMRFRTNKPGLVVAAKSGYAYIHPDDLSRLDYIEKVIPEELREQRLFNDGACDKAGRFYAGSKFSFGYEKSADEPTGILWRLDPDGSIHKIEENLTIPNGIGWSPDDTKMYFTDSQRGIIWVYDYDVRTAAMTNKRVFVDVNKLDGGEPDGLAVDEAGYIWSARYNKAKVTRFTPDGQVDLEVLFPTALNITCPCFGGPRMDDLYVTTAKLTPDDEKNPENKKYTDGGHLFKIRVSVQGLKVNKFGG